MKKIITLILAICAFNVSNAQTPIKIRDARALAVGTTVTVRGLVTNGAELGQTIRYLQDSTAGIAAYYTSTTMPTFATVQRGDSIEVTGTLKDFNALLELDPVTSFRIINSGNPVTPLSITPAELVESNESEIIKLANGTFTGQTTPQFQGNKSYNFVVGATTVQVRINTGSVLIGRVIPTTAVNLTAIVSDFRGTYQVLPRDSADIEFQNIAITTPVTQSNLTSTGVTLSWQTSINGTTRVSYGTSPTSLTQTIDSAGVRSVHNARISNLTAGTIYYVQVSDSANGIRVRSDIFAIATASNSTGAMRVYFNKPVDASFAVGGAAPNETNGGRCESTVISMITNATSTVDVAMYSTASSGIVNALKQAQQRGVRVRYIRDRSATNFLLNDASINFRVLARPTTDLMHNKFFVIDADSVNRSWVIGGSMNNTTGQIYTDPNNMVMIQDQSLARAFVMEFNEMWGGNTAIPDSTNMKFGASKTDNTPHIFNVAGKKVEAYFSPSDRTGQQIVDRLNTANTDLQFGLLIFTYFDLGTAVNNAARRGVRVRGIVDNDTAFASSQINFLQRNGVAVRLDASADEIFHHKYAIIDATNPASDPTVVTGSHNWTNAADTRNDENVIMIHDATVANIFLQEFEARWKSTGVNTKEVKTIEGFEAILSPNPASDFVNIEMTSETNRDVAIMLMSMQGQPLEAHIIRNVSGSSIQTLPLSNLPSGNYILMFQSEGKVTSKVLQVVR